MKKIVAIVSVALVWLTGMFAPAQNMVLANRDYRRAHPNDFVQRQATWAERLYLTLAMAWENALATIPYFAETRAYRRLELFREASRLSVAIPGYAFQLQQQHYTPSALVEKRKELAEKQKRLAQIFDEAGPDYDMAKVKSLEGDSAAKVAEIQKMNKELDTLGEEVDKLASLEAIGKKARGFDSFRQPEDESTDQPTRGADRKTFGRAFVESKAYANRKNSEEAILEVELKTLFQTAAGWAPESTRTGLVVPFSARPIQVLDVIPQLPTGQAAVKWMEETTFTNAAAETAEAGAYPEAALALTEKSQVVQKVAVYLPVTDEQLEDEAEAEAYINQRLPFMIQQRLDGQVLNGNGTAPNLRGILNVAGIQTQAKGADPGPDAIYKGLVKVRTVGFAMPNAVMLHPTDWQNIRLLKTADGIYIWGSPAEAGPARIWGLNVVEALALTAGTGLVGDFANFSALYVRRDIVTAYGYVNDDFIKGRKVLRADMRGAMVVYRPTAFCTVTGL